MLLYAATALLALAIVHRFWVMSQFLGAGSKAVQIFVLTGVTGLCLITNVILPFVVAGALVTVVEVINLAEQI